MLPPPKGRDDTKGGLPKGRDEDNKGVVPPRGREDNKGVVPPRGRFTCRGTRGTIFRFFFMVKAAVESRRPNTVIVLHRVTAQESHRRTKKNSISLTTIDRLFQKRTSLTFCFRRREHDASTVAMLVQAIWFLRESLSLCTRKRMRQSPFWKEVCNSAFFLNTMSRRSFVRPGGVAFEDLKQEPLLAKEKKSKKLAKCPNFC